jgi:hypothetical protein
MLGLRLRANLFLLVLVTIACSSLGRAARAQQLESGSAAGARFRWGLSAAGGPIVGGYSGGAGGIDARFGAQFNPAFALYAQPIVLLGAGASVNARGANASGFALYGVGALADLTLGDLFYLAAGPELLIGGVGTASASISGTASDSSPTGPLFSVASRAGFAFGSHRPNRRKAFTVGLDLHVIFAGNVAVMPLLALGYESY